MKKLLISGLGGSLFPYLAKRLEVNYKLVFIDSNALLKKIYPDLDFLIAPLVSDIHYIDFVKKIIDDFGIDFYIPLIDEELELAKGLEGYNELSVISPNQDFIKLALNKYKLMKILRSKALSYIPSYRGSDFNNQIDPPLFLKPIYGRGSRGIKKINSSDQIFSYYSLEERSPDDTLIQPVIEGTEYTIGVTINNLNDIIAISSKRIINKRGITQCAITENNLVINDMVVNLVNKLKPHGPINIQCFLTPNNEIKIFEINPRFSTTTIMEYEGGVDLIDLYIQNLNERYSDRILTPKEGIMLYRRWENLFYE